MCWNINRIKYQHQSKANRKHSIFFRFRSSDTQRVLKDLTDYFMIYILYIVEVSFGNLAVFDIKVLTASISPDPACFQPVPALCLAGGEPCGPLQ